MKKLLKFTFISLILIVALLLAAPFLFKGKIVSLLQSEANKQLNAELFFENVEISLLKNFPNLAIDIENLRITGKDTFAGIDLVSFRSFNLVVDIKTVLSDAPIGIRNIQLTDANAHIITLADGKFNGDILLEQSSENTDIQDNENTSNAFALQLNGYSIKNFNLIYDDYEGNTFMQILNLNHEGKGDFTQDIVSLVTKTTIDTLDVSYDGIQMLDKVNATSDFDVIYNSLEESITFGANTIRLNQLEMTFEGWIKFLENGLDMDLKFGAPKNDFKSVISLIPAYYYQDFDALKADGSFNLNGFVTGQLKDDDEDYLPSFAFNMIAKNGTISYPDLTEKIEKIALDLNITHPGGALDKMKINLPIFAMEVAKSPISGNFSLATPLSDPDIKTKLKANLDFANLKEVLKDPSFELAGLLDADFSFSGKLSSIEKEAYDLVTAEGGATLQQFLYKSSDFALPVAISSATARLSPQYLDVSDLKMQIGKSDFAAVGRIDNLYQWAFSDTTLIGRFNFSSNLIDANELLSLMEEETDQMVSEETIDTSSTTAPIVPENLDFVLDATVETLLFDVYDITDIKGGLIVKNQKVFMDQVNMKTLGGAINMDGSYSNQPNTAPLTDFSFDLMNLDLAQVFEKVETIKALAPVGAAAKGLLTTKFQFTSELDNELSPVLSSINALGMFRTANIKYASPTLDKIAATLKNDTYKNFNFKNALVDFEVKEGRVFLKPFDMTLGNQTAKLSGSHGIDQSLDYVISGKFPATQMAAALGSIPGADKVKDIDLDILIKGTITKPEIKLETKGMVNSLSDQVTTIVQDEITKVVDNAKEAAKAEITKLIAEAEAKGDQLITAAKNQGDQLRKEAKTAGEKLVAEALQGAEKLQKEAGNNPIKQAAARRAGEELVKKAEKEAANLNATADNNANRLVEEATEQKEKLVSDARKKAEIE